MRECNNCHNLLKEDAMFCDQCGCKWEATKENEKVATEVFEEYQFCSNCGTKNLLSDGYCLGCGSKLKAGNQGKAQKESKKSIKKIFAVCLVIAIMGIVACTLPKFLSKEEVQESSNSNKPILKKEINEKTLQQLVEDTIPQYVLEYDVTAKREDWINFVYTVGTYVATVGDVEILEKYETENGCDISCKVRLDGEFIDRIYYYYLECSYDKTQGWKIISYQEEGEQEILVTSLPQDAFFSLSNCVPKEFNDTTSYKDNTFNFNLREEIMYSYVTVDRQGVGQGQVVWDEESEAYVFSHSVGWSEDTDPVFRCDQIIGLFENEDWKITIASMTSKEASWEITRNKIYDDDIGGFNSGTSSITIDEKYILIPLTVDYSFGISDYDGEEHITHYDCTLKIPIETFETTVYLDAVDPMGYWGGKNFTLEEIN